MGLPVISVEFKKLAATALTRSVRGILAVVIQDTTSGVSWTSKVYTSLDEVDAKEFSTENYKILSRAFLAAPFRLSWFGLAVREPWRPPRPSWTS